MPGHVVAVVVTRAMSTFELAVPCEVFGTDRTDIVDPWYELVFCAAEPGALRTTAGLQVPAASGLEALERADTVLVPAVSRDLQLRPPEPVLAALRSAHRAGRRIVSLCTGAYLVAAAGLLDGRRATTHWMNAMDLAHRFPAVEVVPSVLYVDEGDVLTSAGTAAAIDLCLHLVEKDHGAAVAAEVARRMVVPPHRDGGQAQVPRPAFVGAGRPDGLGPVLAWARERLDQPLTVAQLAAAGHTSPRTLARHFRETLGTTPLRWLVEQRVRLAQELLETTDEPVEWVARRAGFGDATNLRRHFQRVSGVSPRTYRHVFRYRAAAARAGWASSG
jgi:transcriptional regulator GlxA family with amidase domain